MDFGLLKFGILLGFGAAAPIGPVNVEIARRTLRAGFWSGFALGCGAVSVDVFYAILASQGLKHALDRRAVMISLGVAGAGLLLWLAVRCFRAAWGAAKADPLAASDSEPSPPPPRAALGAAYLTGVLMTLLNPMTVAFWFVAVPGALGPITEEPARDLPMICAGVFAGTLGWVVLFAGTLALTRRRAGTGRAKARLPAFADAVGGITLLGFAVVALWRLVASFL